MNEKQRGFGYMLMIIITYFSIGYLGIYLGKICVLSLLCISLLILIVEISLIK